MLGDMKDAHIFTFCSTITFLKVTGPMPRQEIGLHYNLLMFTIIYRCYAVKLCGIDRRKLLLTNGGSCPDISRAPGIDIQFLKQSLTWS